MNGKNQNRNGTVGGDRAQLILIGGLVVAVAVVAIALVIGGGLFSQSTTDDGGLSSFASETSDQVQAAATVGQEDLEFVNENSTLYQGAYPGEVCGNLVNATAVQQLVSTQLSEGESIANVDVKQDCEELKDSTTWLTGQTEEAQLPSVNVTEPVDTTGTKTCSDLHMETGYAVPSYRQDFVDELSNIYSGSIPSDPSNASLEAALTAAGIDLDPIRNDGELDGDGADGVYIYIEKCVELDVQQGRPPADIAFAIDTTGSMGDPAVYSGNYLTTSWESKPYDTPRKTYRPRSDINIRDNWIDVRCSTTTSCTWNGGSSGDIVYDNSANRLAKVTSNSPTTICGLFTCTDYWDVEYLTGGPSQVEESDLYNVDYRLDAPERMWFTQIGMISATDDLNTTVPDRAGLVDYDSTQTEHAQIDGVNKSSHKQNIIDETAQFVPDGGTDITGGLQEAKSVLDRDHDPSTDASKNIVLMTDGNHNTGVPDPVGYIQSNTNDFDDTYIHTVVLGSSAANDQSAVEDMSVLANDGNPDLSSSTVDPSSLPPTTPDRPNGTLIASDDPSDAEDIFDDIIGSIEDTTDVNDNATAGTPDPDLNLSVEITSNSGVIEEIDDARMGFDTFTGNGTYRLAFTDTDGSGNEVTAWEMVVNNTMATSSIGYKVEFSSETHDDDSLNKTLTYPDPSRSDPVLNLSDPSQYVWLDLTGKDSTRPRLNVSGIRSSDMSNPDQLDNTTQDYMQEAWQEVKDEMPVAIVTEETNPFGEVNGTFSLEFKPVNGNFSKVGGIEGGGFDSDCSGGAGSLPEKCGLNDPGNDRGAVSTAQIKEAEIEVTVESPEGRSNRTVPIPPEDEYSYDIFE